MRLLVVAMAESSHTAGWLRQLEGQGWDVHLFSTTGVRPHRGLRDVTVWDHSFQRPPGLHPSVRLRGVLPLRLPVSLLRRLRIDSSAVLARLVRFLNPDLVHSMEIQGAGYLTAHAKKRRPGGFPPWLMTSWGSDIYLHPRLPEHRVLIAEALKAADYFSCEGRRDIVMARSLGFSGAVLPIFPVAGGLELDDIQRLRAPGPTSGRQTIVIKGYQHWAGRALVALEALRRCRELVKELKVILLRPCPDVVMAARLLQADTGIRIELVEGLERREVLALHGRARLSLGLSIGDGMSVSLIEALAMGSFPVQSDTTSSMEFLQDGVNALFVPAEDPAAVARALERALTDDNLVDRGAEKNDQIARDKFDFERLKGPIVENYLRMVRGESLFEDLVSQG